MDIKSVVIRLYGIVQGVGFRPFVSRAANTNGITGSVANKGSYVEVHAQGGTAALNAFIHALKTEAPERSSILKTDVIESDEKPTESFEIIESEKQKGDIFVSPDIATCDKCTAELFDKNNRRYLHPFINCTACGPRLTILDSMPYDRERTSMGEFPMCGECSYEYTHAETRRYDAQPVCCNECGPEVYILGGTARGREAITYMRRAVSQGKIVAIKGIGGFHLCCDARNGAAVKRLRELKNRPSKPFAVMMRDIKTAEKECEVSPYQRQVLTGHQKPIVLLKRKDKSTLCHSVAPDNPNVGVMLPYAPVQMLLFRYDDDVEMTDAFVMTSGNMSGAPICRSDEDAINEIADFCDVILSHNRKIRLRADDSVMDFFENKPYMIRRSRGYAPLPFMLSNDFKGEVLGIGGELKNTFCIGKNELFYLSPYIGDMADVRTLRALRESVRRMETLLEVKPQAVACDLHPRYNTVLAAEETGLPLIRVQHHYAHILSCMAENDYSGEVIGVSFDGTGYGTDGSVWGGEFMRADYGSFERLGSVRPFVQVGGDASAREGWRIAASMIHSIYGEQGENIAEKLSLANKNEYKVVSVMADKFINSIVSTSAGRLFDAVSAILGIKKESGFEGEASTALQFAAEKFSSGTEGKTVYNVSGLVCENAGRTILNTDKLVKLAVESKIGGGDVCETAYAFHLFLSQAITEACCNIRSSTGLSVCALSGGVFQNTLLTAMCAQRLRDKGFKVLLHSLVPPNDGGIALGQAVNAMYKLNNK